MLLTRERFRHFLKSLWTPARSPLPAAGGAQESGWSRAPRTPRVVTVLLLAVAVAILLHPQTRTCLQSVLLRQLWKPDNWSSFHQIQRKAAETGDPELKALLAMLQRTNAERLRLGKEAIDKDSSLTWLNYRSYYPAQTPEERQKLYATATQRASHLKNWDPDNAVPHLYAAEMIFWDIVTTVPEGSTNSPGGDQKITAREKAAAANDEWRAEMDKAYRAPKYDAYTARRFQVVRNVAARYGINDPSVTEFAVGIGTPPLLINVIAYAHVLLYDHPSNISGPEEERAITDAYSALHFAERMHLHSLTSLEEMIASRIAKEASERLQLLLEEAGRRDEAAQIGLELERWTNVMDRIRSRNQTWISSYHNGLVVWAGLAIHIAAVASVALLVLAILSLAFFLVRSNSTNQSGSFFVSLCSFVADLAPPLLLFSCFVLFAVYRPYATVYASYFEVQRRTLDIESMENLATATAVPYMLPPVIERALLPEHLAVVLWSSVTVSLAMIAVFMIFRMWWRRRTI